MGMFEEIDKVKKEVPKIKSLTRLASNIETNTYQKISLILFFIGLFMGIFFGNLFPSCGSSSEFYSNVCATTEFNFSLMLFIWLCSFLISLFYYGIGSIIALLNSINSELNKMNLKWLGKLLFF